MVVNINKIQKELRSLVCLPAETTVKFIKLYLVYTSLVKKTIRTTIAGIGMFLGTVLPSFAQDYTLSGKVRELERTTGAPMTAVKIDVDSSSFIAFTDANGNYSISGIPTGVHNIRVSKPGFIGMFKKNYTLDGNKVFNVSLADTIQESPQGTQVLKLDEFRELPPFTTYKGLNRVGSTAYPSDNASTWNGITEGNLIPVLLLNATAYDSLQFKNAIGACNGDWTQSPAGSVEKEQKRALYLLSNDPQVSYTKRGMRVTFNAGSTRSSISEYEANSPYIYTAETTLASNGTTTIQKEVQGRDWSKGNVFSRPSYMNSLSTGMTDLDHMINIVFYNQWAAIGRSEQNANILDMENTPTFSTPTSTNITKPLNNASNLEKAIQIQYDNVFGADVYELQASDKEDFSTLLMDLDVLRTDTTLTLNDEMTYFFRVRATNYIGSGAWSNVIKATINSIPTGIVDIGKNHIRAYPVPVLNYLNLEYEPNVSGIRILISMDGKVIDFKIISGVLHETINMSSYKSGIYTISLYSTSFKTNIRIIKK